MHSTFFRSRLLIGSTQRLFQRIPRLPSQTVGMLTPAAPNVYDGVAEKGEREMTDDIAKQTTELMAVAKRVAQKEFGEESVAAHPEIVATLFQGIASLEQAKAMEQLGKDICAAAAHARGE